MTHLNKTNDMTFDHTDSSDQPRDLSNCPGGVAILITNQRSHGPVNTHLLSWPSKAQNIQNLENIW